MPFNGFRRPARTTQTTSGAPCLTLHRVAKSAHRPATPASAARAPASRGRRLFGHTPTRRLRPDPKSRHAPQHALLQRNCIRMPFPLFECVRSPCAPAEHPASRPRTQGLNKTYGDDEKHRTKFLSSSATGLQRTRYNCILCNRKSNEINLEWACGASVRSAKAARRAPAEGRNEALASNTDVPHRKNTVQKRNGRMRCPCRCLRRPLPTKQSGRFRRPIHPHDSDLLARAST